MAVTIYHKVINNNKIVIINKGENKKPVEKSLRIKGNIKTTRHTLTEARNYD